MATTSIKQRLRWVTTAKALGLIGVVLVHAPLSSVCKNHFSFYALPVFFVVAGMFFKDGQTLRQAASNNFVRLIIPYGGFALVSFVEWLFFRQVFGWQSEIPIIKPVIGTLLGNGISPWMAHNIPLWFLPCFYLSLVYFQIVKQLAGRWLPFAVAGLAVIGFYLPRFLPFWLPWSMELAVLACVFVALGYLLKNWLKREAPMPWWALVLCIALNTLAFHCNGGVDLNWRQYGPFIGWYYLGALSGVLMFFEISKRLPAFRILDIIGTHSLTILGLHSIGINLMYHVYSALFHVPSLEGFHGLRVLFPSLPVLTLGGVYALIIFTFLLAGIVVPLFLQVVYSRLLPAASKIRSFLSCSGSYCSDVKISGPQTELV